MFVDKVDKASLRIKTEKGEEIKTTQKGAETST